MDVWIQPGDTSLYHRHALPSIFVFLTQSEIGTQILGEGKVPLSTVVGQTWFAGYENGPQVHRAWTTGVTPLHAIDIELLQSKKKSNASTTEKLEHPYLRLIGEHAPVRMYNLELAPYQQARIEPNGSPFVLICWEGNQLSVQSVRETKLSQGTYQWWDGSKSISLNNRSSEFHKVYFYEILK